MRTVEVLGDRYRLVDQLGRGGMAVVWRAFDEVLDRQVAVKVLAAKFAGGTQSRGRVLAEARAAARLTHPHIGAVYDYGESVTDNGDRVPFVVMELLIGRSLEQRLKQGSVAILPALRICAQVASALAAAHSRGLVHRDVKPANVMLTRAGAKVVDFGLAAVAGEPTRNDAGGLLGTPAYLAPERLSGETVVAATDVYALGLLLYRLLAGRLPWKADTTTQMLVAHTYIEPAPLPRLPGVPLEVADLVRRCLAKDPARRPLSGAVAVTLADAAGIQVPPNDDDADGADGADEPEASGSALESGRPAAGSPAEPAPAADSPAEPALAVVGSATVGSAAVGSAAVGSAIFGPRPSLVIAPGQPYAARLARHLDVAADHVELRRQASALLRTAVGFDLALWAVLDPVTLMWASCVVDGGPHDDRLEHELFANEYGQRDVLKLIDLAEGSRVGTLSATTQGDLRMSGRFRNVLNPRGFRDELRVVFSDRDTAWGALCLYRTGGQFTDADLAQVAPASRPFAVALRRSLLRAEAAGAVSRPVARPAARPAARPVARPAARPAARPTARPVARPTAAGSDAAAAVPVRYESTPLAGTVTITRDGGLLGMTDGARTLLRPGELARIIAAVAGGRVSGPVDPTTTSHHDGRWLAFHAAPSGAELVVAVRRISPHQVSGLIADGLGLRPGQLRLLGRVARVHDIRLIANQLRVSAYTVQDGLVSLFAAFGVDGRVELVKTLFFDHYLPWHAPDTRLAGAAGIAGPEIES